MNILSVVDNKDNTILVSGALSVVSCFSFFGVLQAVKSRPEIKINKVFLIMT